MDTSTDELVLVTESAAATEALAARLSRLLEPGDRLLLRGDLGGGKTTFTRGLLTGLGLEDPREVCSPTFALHNRYEGGRIPVDHLDLYRVTAGSEGELASVLEPLEDPESLTVIEWSERLLRRPEKVAAVLAFRFVDETRREIIARFDGPRAAELRRAAEAQS